MTARDDLKRQLEQRAGMADETAAERVADALTKTADQISRQLHDDGWVNYPDKPNDRDWRKGYESACRDAVKALRE